LGELVAPQKIIICESREGDGFDAECYNKIFSHQFPDAKFISAGGKGALKNYIPVIRAVAKGVEVFALRDRANATDDEIEHEMKKEVRVLRRCTIENYLLDDAVLRELCQKFWPEDEEKPNKLIELRSNYEDNQAKAASYEVFKKATAWRAPHIGSKRERFLCDTLAPLIQPGMVVYEELKAIIFEGRTWGSDLQL